MYNRLLDLTKLLTRKSLFLMGPRQTGKTTFLKSQYPKALYIDLLDLDLFRELNHNPSNLLKWIEKDKSKLVILDEIQKMPELLNQVHRIIESKKEIRFILTGSSARKLKKQGVNMLGGRASQINMLPLSLFELGPLNDISSVINFGSLPFIISSTEPKSDLKDYVQLYLQYEIREEALVKNYLNFSRFIDFAASTNGEILNFTSLGNDAQISPRTVQDYYLILEDTLLGTVLPPYRKTNRKVVVTSKFYFFDLGVCNYLQGRLDIKKGTPEYGKAFEHLVFNELKAFQNYNYDKKIELFFWRTQNHLEVDFILEIENQLFAIEIKSTAHPRLEDLPGLRAFGEAVPNVKKLVVCHISRSYTEQEIYFYNIKDFVKKLWSFQLHKK